jgi:hypothetical protein
MSSKLPTPVPTPETTQPQEGDVLGPEAGIWEGATLISRHTRAQMLEDGDLVPVPEDAASMAGLKWPAAFTRAA